MALASRRLGFSDVGINVERYIRAWKKKGKENKGEKENIVMNCTGIGSRKNLYTKNALPII